jgi:CRP-like cAMP-binding protein
VAQIGPGQYFGEIELLRGCMQHVATIRASEAGPVEVAAMDRETFNSLVAASASTRQALEQVARERLTENEDSREPAPTGRAGG